MSELGFKPVDITGWDAGKRSIRYRITDRETCFGLLIGNAIDADGKCPVVLYRENAAQTWHPGRRRYGKAIEQWQFVNDPPEAIERLLSIISGELKPGAPLPAIEAEDDGFSHVFNDPMVEKPARNTRAPAVKNSRL